MYTIKLLAPMLLSVCAEEFLNRQGDYCVVDETRSNVVKYYEPGKSCYKNGIFYKACENSSPVEY